jgi:hypothetical protein
VKVAAKFEGTSSPTLAEYNCWDTFATASLHLKEQELLHAHGQAKFLEEEIEPCYPAVVAMQLRGVPIDVEERTRIRRGLRAEVRDADRLLCDRAGHPYADYWEDSYGNYNGFKPNSDPQIRRWLFGADRASLARGTKVTINSKGATVECLGLKPAGRTEGGQWSVDQTNLVRVLRDLRKMDEHALPILHALTHRARFLKLDEYLDFEVTDGRVYPTVKMHGTKSLRFAYSNPPLHSWASEIRGMVRAPNGKLLMKGDFSAIEARLAAYLSGDKLDIAVYERAGTPPYKHHPDWDIHARLVLDTFRDLTEEKWRAMPVEERELYRGAAKVLRYGVFQYGGEPESAKDKTFCPCPKCEGKKPPVLDLTPARKRQIHDAWMGKHFAFPRWRNQLLQPFRGAHATHMLSSPFGWRRWFHTPNTPELHREVWAWMISVSASTIKLRALRRLHAAGLQVLFDHHDALMCEIDADHVDDQKELMVRCMSEAVPELGGIRFPVEVAVGESWAALH